MSVFVVIKQGVYIRGVHGPFDRAQAEAVARQRAAVEHDSYHSFDVVPLGPNGLGQTVARFVLDSDRNFNHRDADVIRVPSIGGGA